jgi:K+-sensing histidine kinase KdpD
MADYEFDVLDDRAGSEWCARAGADERIALITGLLGRFNHDLRTPLNTVFGWTHLMQQGAVDSARTKHVAEVLARNTREQTVLLDEFVDDGRAVLGVLKPDAVELPLEPLMTNALERAAPMLSLHSVSATAKFEVENAVVEGDERRLTRLIYRLLAAVARRARESATIELAVLRKSGMLPLRIHTPANGSDWPEAALLDLKISSFAAATLGAELAIDGDRANAAVVLGLRPLS